VSKETYYSVKRDLLHLEPSDVDKPVQRVRSKPHALFRV
jgi:hypothetical protein